MSGTDRHPADALTADPPRPSFSRQFPTFYFLWKSVISFGNGLWRRRRAIASAMVVLPLTLVVLYGCWESVVGPQRNAVSAIQKAGGAVGYEWDWNNGRPAPPGAEPPWPPWLVRALGRDVFGNVVTVDLVGGRADDALMTHIGGLTHLQRLNLNATSLTGTGLARLEKLTALEILALPKQRFSDDDLAHLAGLTKLKQLHIYLGAQITDRGLAHFAGMRQMESLALINAKITTLEPIRGLTQLKQLNLHGAPITDGGLKPLEDFKSLLRLSLARSRVTDAGMTHLSTLSNLVMLDLNQTAVGDAGARLLFDLPRISSLNLYETRVTDAGLAELADRMSRGPLQSLVVTGASVTPGGVDELRKKLPYVGVMGPGDLRMPRPRARAAPAASIADEELPR